MVLLLLVFLLPLLGLASYQTDWNLDRANQLFRLARSNWGVVQFSDYDTFRFKSGLFGPHSSRNYSLLVVVSAWNKPELCGLCREASEAVADLGLSYYYSRSFARDFFLVYVDFNDALSQRMLEDLGVMAGLPVALSFPVRKQPEYIHLYGDIRAELNKVVHRLSRKDIKPIPFTIVKQVLTSPWTHISVLVVFILVRYVRHVRLESLYFTIALEVLRNSLLWGFMLVTVVCVGLGGFWRYGNPYSAQILKGTDSLIWEGIPKNQYIAEAIIIFILYFLMSFSLIGMSEIRMHGIFLSTCFTNQKLFIGALQYVHLMFFADFILALAVYQHICGIKGGGSPHLYNIPVLRELMLGSR